MMTNIVYSRTKRPRLHAFGHIHSQFGYGQYESTILSNASQERVVRTDPAAGGIPLVIDLPLEPATTSEETGRKEEANVRPSHEQQKAMNKS